MLEQGSKEGSGQKIGLEIKALCVLMYSSLEVVNALRCRGICISTEILPNLLGEEMLKVYLFSSEVKIYKILKISIYLKTLVIGAVH